MPSARTRPISASIGARFCLRSDVLPAMRLPGMAGWVVALVLLSLFGVGTGFTPGHWLFAVLLLLHACVGYVELGTDSWIQNITGTILSDPMKGQMVFVWTSAVMFVLRFFAGRIVNNISPHDILLHTVV